MFLKPLPFHFIRLLALVALGAGAAQSQAQGSIFRCGNEYTNDPQLAKSKGCTPMRGGNITIVEGTKVAPAARSTPAASSRSSGERVNSAAQRARDSDARAILEAELRKAEERLAQARKEYANGEPEKQGIESRNYQRYLDRVADLKAAVGRAESDVASLQRELARVGGSPNSSGSASK